MLDRETFLDSLKGHFKDDIQNIIHQCQHYGQSYLDVDTLNQKLVDLHSFAIKDGLSEDDWLEIVFELCPDIYDRLDFGPIAA